MRTNKSTQSNIPTLIHENKKYESDKEKADLFKSILEKTFSQETDKNFTEKEFYDQVDANVNSNEYINSYQHTNNEYKEITIFEIKLAISACKNQSASGFDGIHNQMIKHLPENFIEYIKILFNKNLSNSSMCQSWKISKITMIGKKDNEKQNPNNYRPISVTSCIGKILERILNTRFYEFCEKNNVLAYQQSGFRKHRGTKDNIIFLTQKIIETFNRKKKMCCIFFDISKAFDKVWHNGLIFKLTQLKCPLYLLKWLKEFLKERKFRVKINNVISDLAEITAAVPQGSPLSPTLFDAYINDIPKRDTSNCSSSLLYADDLATMFIFNKRGQIEQTINKYLVSIEKWLIKWKLKMSASKCNYTIFHSGPTRPVSLNLNLFGSKIPFEENPTFLGITFDERLTFKNHVKNVKTKVQNRLNIIRIISSNFWKLNSTFLLQIYSALVRSITDCLAFAVSRLSNDKLDTIQAIQNSAFRSMFHLPFDTSSEKLRDLAKSYGFPSLVDRANYLNETYFEKCMNFSNPLIIKLACEYRKGFQARNIEHRTILCPHSDVFSIIVMS